MSRFNLGKVELIGAVPETRRSTLGCEPAARSSAAISVLPQYIYKIDITWRRKRKEAHALFLYDSCEIQFSFQFILSSLPARVKNHFVTKLFPGALSKPLLLDVINNNNNNNTHDDKNKENHGHLRVVSARLSSALRACLLLWAAADSGRLCRHSTSGNIAALKREADQVKWRIHTVRTLF